MSLSPSWDTNNADDDYDYEEDDDYDYEEDEYPEATPSAFAGDLLILPDYD